MLVTESTIYFIILVTLLLVGGWLAFSGRFRQRGAIGNLFLAVRVKAKGRSDQICYLRKLSPLRAEFVSTTPFERSARVSLFLDSLPGFPQFSGRSVQCVVQECRQMKGFPASFRTKVQFSLNDASYRGPLEEYILQLSGENNRHYA